MLQLAGQRVHWLMTSLSEDYYPVYKRVHGAQLSYY